MNVLLHICCAGCAIYPLEALRKAGHRVAGYFYNPNIHPYSEYLKRKATVEKFAGESGLNVIFADYEIEHFFQYIVYNESSQTARDIRCPACWWLRLEKAAAFAKENGFEAFTTTLLGSPYQDQGVIKDIGADIARRFGLIFYFEDFREGFKAAQDLARSKGMYLQNYCGCVFSEKERIEEKAAKKSEKSGKGPKTVTLSVKGSKKNIICSM
jgi:predicted adenine nucleotide alpha hydrolase (AANH) superfamily ATPase